jgi:hypothetical protein
MADLQILTSRGSLRPLSSFSKDEMDGLTPEQRASFDSLRAVLQSAEDCTAELAKAVAQVEAAVIVRNAALAEKAKHNITFQDLWRSVTGKPPLPPKALG